MSDDGCGASRARRRFSRRAGTIGDPDCQRSFTVPYRLRVRTPSDQVVAIGELASKVVPAKLSVESGSDAAWEELLLAHPDGREIALIERNVVSPGSMGEEELQEFVEELELAQPESGARWVRDYLGQVKTIYAIQVLSGADRKGGWDAIGAIKSRIWSTLGGIIQADHEGFTDEDGYHAVWQFSDTATGPWWMGLLKDGAWVHFQMELGDREQREAFLRGDVPDGAKPKP